MEKKEISFQAIFFDFLVAEVLAVLAE